MSPEGLRPPIEEWHAQANCNDGHASMLDLFFSFEQADIEAAKEVCRDCPVREICLDTAIERHEPWGVWGGQELSNGKIVGEGQKRRQPEQKAS